GRLEPLRVRDAQPRVGCGEVVARSARRAYRFAESLVAVDANAPGQHDTAIAKEQLVQRVTGEVADALVERRVRGAERRILGRRIRVPGLVLVLEADRALERVTERGERRVGIARVRLREEVRGQARRVRGIGGVVELLVLAG